MKASTNLAALPLQLIALVTLILATITGPAVPQLALANHGSHKYGALGYCDADASSRSDCTLSISYAPSHLDHSSDWAMSSSVRDRVATIMVVAPVAAGLTLFALFVNLVGIVSRAAAMAGFYWLVAILFALLAFVASALVCVVSFLLFYPHIQWPCWLLIPGAVLNLISVVLVAIAAKFVRDAYLRDEEDDRDDDDNNQFGWNEQSSVDDEDEHKFGMVNTNAASVPPPKPDKGGLTVVPPPPANPMGFIRHMPKDSNTSTNANLLHGMAGPPANGGMFSSKNPYGETSPFGNIIGGGGNSNIPPPLQRPTVGGGSAMGPAGGPADDGLSFAPSASYGAHSNAEQTHSTIDDHEPLDYQRDFTYSNDNVAPRFPSNNNRTSSFYGTQPATPMDANVPSLKIPEVYLGDEDAEGKVRGDDSRLQGQNGPHSGNSSDSDFTSVSQRGINPKYYGAAPRRVSLMSGVQQPNGNESTFSSSYDSQQPQSAQPRQSSSSQYPMSTPYYPANQTPQQPPGQSYDSFAQSQQSGYSTNSYNSYNTAQSVPPPQQPQGPSRADVILDNSPSLMVGTGSKPGVRRYGMRQVSQQRMAQGAAPAQGQAGGQPFLGSYNNYKNRQQQRQSFPTPSAMGEGPYGRI